MFSIWGIGSRRDTLVGTSPNPRKRHFLRWSSLSFRFENEWDEKHPQKHRSPCGENYHYHPKLALFFLTASASGNPGMLWESWFFTQTIRASDLEYPTKIPIPIGAKTLKPPPKAQDGLKMKQQQQQQQQQEQEHQQTKSNKQKATRNMLKKIRWNKNPTGSQLKPGTRVVSLKHPPKKKMNKNKWKVKHNDFSCSFVVLDLFNGDV